MEINIVDAVMGAGKTQSIMNYIRGSDETEKFLVITPYLNEVDRYRKYCVGKNFKTPKFGYDQTKLSDLKSLISKGESIVSTHALFQKFDNELIDLCRIFDYTLIMDEVADVIEEYELSKQDANTLLTTYTNTDKATGRLIWKEEQSDYIGKFGNEKRLCNLGSLVLSKDNIMVWMFPVDVFYAFRKIFILTYRFDLQFQKYYYDYYGLGYRYWSVDGDSLEDYHLIDYDPKKKYFDYDYQELIHICDIDRMNMIGDRKSDLSKSWYERNKDNAVFLTLKNNIYNYFHNIRNTGTELNLWTTFKDYEHLLRGKGYAKGFLPLNSRATNEYRTRNSIAYPVNRYINPFVKNFFTSNGVEVDEDGYALSEMLQFIWRSAIRDGGEIWIYIPSERMRTLLEQWIVNNAY